MIFLEAATPMLDNLANFPRTKFTIYRIQPPNDVAVQPNTRKSRRFHAKQVSPRLPAYNYVIAFISYELNVLRTRGPRRINCVIPSVPVTAIQEGGIAPAPTSFSQYVDDKSPFIINFKRKGACCRFQLTQPLKFSCIKMEICGGSCSEKQGA